MGRGGEGGRLSQMHAFKNKPCTRKKNKTVHLFPSWSEIFEMHRLQSVRNLQLYLVCFKVGVRHKERGIWPLKALPAAFADCQHNRCVLPSKEEKKAEPTPHARTGTVLWTPPTKHLKSLRGNLFSRLRYMIGKRGLSLWPSEKTVWGKKKTYIEL